jgi:tetratricopeptide (TPR) repeat protein
VAVGGDIKNSTINFGLTDEQLRQVTKAAVEGATGPLIDRISVISKTLGVTEDAAKTLLKIAGEQPDVPDENLAQVLSKIADDYKQLKTTVAALNPANPTAQALVAQANAAIKTGDFTHAHDLLHQATQAQIDAAQEARKLSDQARAAADAEMLGAASSTAAEGDVALTEHHYVQAADLFKRAAALVPPGHSDNAASYLERHANALYRQGDEKGDNTALQQSIEIWHLVLQQRPREQVPRQWAETQYRLGLVLETLGERESGTAHLEEAVAAYRAALEEIGDPASRATVENNLYGALELRDKRKSEAARLEEAVTAERSALEKYTRERVPLQWARTQNSLGLALARLGEQEGGTARLKEAVAAYRAALDELTRDRVPFEWAVIQNNLGVALATLGERESGTARLKDAVAAYRAALEELPRDRAPRDWATIQKNLGVALATLGERESGTERLEEAIAAYRAALEELPRDQVPWAETQNDLMLALQKLDKREGGITHFQEVMSAGTACRTVPGVTCWPVFYGAGEGLPSIFSGFVLPDTGW